MTGLLDITGASKTWHRRGTPDRIAMRDVDLHLGPGRHIALIGPSGAGKSTVVRVALGLVPLDAGDVLVHGRRLRGGRRADRWVRRLVQPVMQDASGSLDPRFTVGRSLAEPVVGLGLPDDPHERARELVALVGLPAGVIDRRPDSLSGGQRQRVAMARALAARPQLLIGDEMLSALDATTRLALVEMLRDVVAAEGTTLMLVSHDIGAARLLCDDVVVMDRGSVVERGSTAEVLTDPRHAVTRSLVTASRRVLR